MVTCQDMAPKWIHMRRILSACEKLQVNRSRVLWPQFIKKSWTYLFLKQFFVPLPDEEEKSAFTSYYSLLLTIGICLYFCGRKGLLHAAYLLCLIFFFIGDFTHVTLCNPQSIDWLVPWVKLATARDFSLTHLSALFSQLSLPSILVNSHSC